MGVQGAQGRVNLRKLIAQFLRIMLALGLSCTAATGGQSEKDKLQEKPWLAGDWRGTFSLKFEELDGPAICKYKGEGTVYLHVSVSQSGLDGFFNLSGTSYDTVPGIHAVCPSKKKGTAQFEIIRFIDLNGQSPAIEVSLKKCEGGIGFDFIDICSSTFASFTEGDPLLGSYIGNGTVDRHGLVMTDAFLTRLDPDRVILHPTFSGQKIELHKDPDLTPSMKASADEKQADQHLYSAIVDWSIYFEKNDGSFKESAVTQWELAKQWWQQAVGESSDPEQISRLRGKLSGGGIICSRENPDSADVCISVQSDKLCAGTGPTCIPRSAF